MVHLDSNPVVAQQRGEVGRLERVHRVHELGAVERVGGREHAAREQAQLHEPRHRLVLGRLGRARGEPAAALARQPRQHARHVLRLAPPLLLAAERDNVKTKPILFHTNLFTFNRELTELISTFVRGTVNVRLLGTTKTDNLPAICQ